MKDNLTEIIIAADDTSIFSPYVDEFIDSYKDFIKSLKKSSKDFRITFAKIGGNSEFVFENKSISSANISSAVFSPSGVSTILDSISKIMYDVGVRYTNTAVEEIPSEIVFVICALGKDNGSVKCTYENLKNMVRHQMDVYNWKFFGITDTEEAIRAVKAVAIPSEQIAVINQNDSNRFTTPFENLKKFVT